MSSSNGETVSVFEERKDDIINAINASTTPYLLARNIGKITGMVPGVDFSYIFGIKPLVVVMGHGRDEIMQRVDPCTGEGVMNSKPITSEEIQQGREQFTREELALIEADLTYNNRSAFYSFIRLV